MNLKEASTGKWRSILGGIIGESYFTGKHGPCPICEKHTGDGGKDRFRFSDRNGSGSYICSQCGNSGGGIYLLAQYLDVPIPAAWEVVRKVLPSADYEEPKKKQDYSKLIAALLKESTPVTDYCEVYNYLHGRLAHVLKHTGKQLVVPASIRQGTYIDYSDPMKPSYAAMLCRVEKNGKLTGLHITLLKDGKKAPIESPRRLLAVHEDSLKGSAIHLSDERNAVTLVVGEGVETCMAASLYFGFPAWSAMNSTLLEQVKVPGEIKNVIVAGDNDEKFGGHAAAYVVAHRMAVEGKRVKVKIPAGTGRDWCDVELLLKR